MKTLHTPGPWFAPEDRLDFPGVVSTVDSSNYKMIDVLVEGADEEDVLNHFSIEEVIKHFGESEFLNRIGEDAVIKYFDLEIKE